MENYDDAITVYIQLQHENDSDEIQYHLGNCFYMKQQYDLAIEHYEKALNLNPNNSDCLYNLGSLEFLTSRKSVLYYRKFWLGFGVVSKMSTIGA